MIKVTVDKGKQGEYNKKYQKKVREECENVKLGRERRKARKKSSCKEVLLPGKPRSLPDQGE